MSYWLRALIVVPEDLDSIPNTFKVFPVVWNSSSRRSDTFSHTSYQATYRHTIRQNTKTYKIKIIK